MKVENDSIEKQIIKAARKVFITKGYDGARIREIAAEAGVNFSLVNYHFHSKDNLFIIVFDDIFDTLLEGLSSILNDDVPLFEKIRRVVSLYIDIMIDNQDIPVFIISELARNPERLKTQILSKHFSYDNLKPLFDQIKSESRAGLTRPVEPVNLFLNIISLCIFPILAKPVAEIILSVNGDQYNVLLKSRKDEITKFVIHAIQNSKPDICHHATTIK
ncbi:MAG: TetR/AcrR family transcriptional regulator [Candidatus Azobacteroides sp.]|nr:TetR/AcrR family transcriptional regulator [Candidatus Azobacteroides sp.]